jgi:hypothetical protein
LRLVPRGLSETDRLRTRRAPLSENYLDAILEPGDVSDIHFGWFELMPRIFAYVRVSTTGQTTENQIREIETAGFTGTLRSTFARWFPGLANDNSAAVIHRAAA